MAYKKILGSSRIGLEKAFFFFFNELWTINRPAAAFYDFDFLNFIGGLEGKQIFLYFFQFVASCSAKPSLRILPGATSRLPQNPVLSNSRPWDLTKMFRLLIQFMFNSTVCYSVTWHIQNVLNEYLYQKMAEKQSSKTYIIKPYGNKMSIKKSFLKSSCP